MRQEVNTPSQVPKRTLSDTRKWDNHHGCALEPCIKKTSHNKVQIQAEIPQDIIDVGSNSKVCKMYKVLKNILQRKFGNFELEENYIYIGQIRK